VGYGVMRRVDCSLDEWEEGRYTDRECRNSAMESEASGSG